MSQNARILSYLSTGRALTPLEALSRFNCMRLSARIQDLQKRGHRIRTQIIPLRKGKRVAMYSL